VDERGDEMKKVITTERVPVKMWLDDVEDSALEQAKNIANLPFAYRHVALMPDAHMGYGMPIGGVLATKGVVVPNSVGVDIGCGMSFVGTTIPAAVAKEAVVEDKPFLEAICKKVKRIVPVGFSKHKQPQEWVGFDSAPDLGIIKDNLENAAMSLGTLGGGNHFIEFQEDQNGRLCVMLHSGSRNLGKRICDFFTSIAKRENSRWYSSVDSSKSLSFLPMDTFYGEQYWKAMEFAMEFAKQNRHLMMERIKNLLFNMLRKYAGVSHSGIELEVNVHHNYAAKENHFGENVIVHRKGATRARDGEYGIIPGSQGTKSYIVVGKGNQDSFHSCSHGAGRIMGRKAAQRTLSLEEEKRKLDEQGIVHGIRTKEDLDEASGAYKPIDVVMANQMDLVGVEMELHPLAVIKG
jgi:tRNA-splicing ligase RtcB